MFPAEPRFAVRRGSLLPDRNLRGAGPKPRHLIPKETAVKTLSLALAVAMWFAAPAFAEPYPSSAVPCLKGGCNDGKGATPPSSTKPPPKPPGPTQLKRNLSVYDTKVVRMPSAAKQVSICKYCNFAKK